MLKDNTDTIVQKIRKAKTDPKPLPNTLEEAKERPEAYNLLTIYAALSEIETKKAIQLYANKEFSMFKNDLTEIAVDKLSPITKEINKLLNDKEYLDSIIKVGKEKAIAIADPVLTKVYEIVGFSRI